MASRPRCGRRAIDHWHDGLCGTAAPPIIQPRQTQTLPAETRGITRCATACLQIRGQYGREKGVAFGCDLTVSFRSLPLQIMACLGVGRFENTLNGFVQHGVELSIGLLGREPFCKRPREAGDNAVISAQAVVGFFSRIAT